MKHWYSICVHCELWVMLRFRNSKVNMYITSPGIRGQVLNWNQFIVLQKIIDIQFKNFWATKIVQPLHLLSTCLNQAKNVSGHVFCVLGVSIFPLSRIVVLEFWNCFDSAEFCVYFIVILTFIGISYMFPSIPMWDIISLRSQCGILSAFDPNVGYYQPSIPMWDIISINELTLILKIINEFDVKHVV